MVREGILGLYACCMTIALYLVLWHINITNDKNDNTSFYVRMEKSLNDELICATTAESSAEGEGSSNIYERRRCFDKEEITGNITLGKNKTGENSSTNMNLSISQASNCGNLPCTSSLLKKKKRKLIFILAQGRSGSSLLGDLFNRDEKAFYMFEPCLAVERLNKFFHFETDNSNTLEFYKHEALSFLSGISVCESNREFDKYINAYDEVGSRSRTVSFSKTPFRSKRISSNLVLQLCNNLTTYTVIKELEFRLPDKKIETLVNLSENLHIDLRLIHLVRDPRAYLLSQMKLQWFFEETNSTKRRMDVYIKDRCKETLNYLKEVANSREKFEGKLEYLLVRYENLIDHPDETLKKVSDATGIDIYKASRHWFANMTKGKDLGERNRYQNGVRNAAAVKNAWKSNISKKLLDIIQKDCAELMKELKYTPYHKKNIL